LKFSWVHIFLGHPVFSRGGKWLKVDVNNLTFEKGSIPRFAPPTAAQLSNSTFIDCMQCCVISKVVLIPAVCMCKPYRNGEMTQSVGHGPCTCLIIGSHAWQVWERLVYSIQWMKQRVYEKWWRHTYFASVNICAC